MKIKTNKQKNNNIINDIAKTKQIKQDPTKITLYLFSVGQRFLGMGPNLKYG